MKIEKIYFDLDGVLADFDKGVIELCKYIPLDQEKYDGNKEIELWNAIRKVDHFYKKLDLIPGSKEMFDYIYNKYKNKCEILTGIPKPHRNIANAAEDKISWSHEKLSPDIKVNIVYKEDKKLFCKNKNCILIDDLIFNINDWKSFGGTAIHFKNAAETIDIINRLGDE